MGNQAGWGAFAQGVAGGLMDYSNKIMQGAQLGQQQEKIAMEKDINILQQEHMNLVNDASKFEAASKVIEKSTDIAAMQNYIDKIQLKNPFYKDTLSAYAIADASTKKELKDFSESVTKLITTPSSDAFSKAELKLAEAGARFGADSNTYKSLKATMDIMKDAYGRDVTPKLVQQIDLGWQTMQKLGQEQPATSGLLQKQPGISDEELNAVNSFKTNLAELSRWSKPEYDRIVGQYGLNKPVEKEKIDEWSLRERAAKGDTVAQSILNQKQKEEIEKRKAGKTTISNVVTMKEETEEAKAVGKAHGEMYVETQKIANESRKQMVTLNQLESYLGKVNTGKLTPTLKTLSEYAEAVGFKIDKSLPYAQAAESLTNQMALQLRSPAAGMGMPGQMSDQDREFLMKLPPGISKTKKGNELILKAFKENHQRNIEVAQKASQYRKTHKTFDAGDFNSTITQEYSGKSLFNIPEGAVLIEGKATKDTGLPVYKLPSGQLWSP